MNSKLSGPVFLAMVIYVQVITIVTGVPFVFALAGGSWIIAVLALIALFLFTVPLALVLHVRNLRKNPTVTNFP
jgi:uncharacterized protein YebE (UPF0316 family)